MRINGTYLSHIVSFPRAVVEISRYLNTQNALIKCSLRNNRETPTRADGLT